LISVIQVKDEIQEFIEHLKRTERKAEGPRLEIPFVIRKYLKSLEIVRDQVELIGWSQAAHEIFHFTYITLVVTLVIFMTLSPLSRGREPDEQAIIENFGGLAFLMLRLYMKAHYSDQILYEVSRDANAKIDFTA